MGLCPQRKSTSLGLSRGPHYPRVSESILYARNDSCSRGRCPELFIKLDDVLFSFITHLDSPLRTPARICKSLGFVCLILVDELMAVPRSLLHHHTYLRSLISIMQARRPVPEARLNRGSAVKTNTDEDEEVRTIAETAVRPKADRPPAFQITPSLSSILESFERQGNGKWQAV